MTDQAVIKKALLELRRLRNQVRTLKRERVEPVAVVGMACRFPGGSDTPEAFWDLLINGRSGVVEVPKSRWDIDEYYDPDPDAPGKVTTRWGGYIGEIDGFDHRFFGISPKEAAAMDPQQRLILEVAWEALERANIDPGDLYGSDTGVFLGYGNWEHAVLRFGMEPPEKINAYTGTGSCGCVASGRIAYFLGLRGPNFAVDTACSSSLLSTHLASQSLRRGECNLALAGGAHLLLTPAMTICFSRARMMALDGRCKTFDAAADGYVRGEGCGMLVLKRLGDALADGDEIYALVRGSASNQDGASGGLTVPSGPAQEDVIHKALADGEIDPARVSYIEAHGTGTKLGDPVEIGAIGNVYCKSPRPRPLVIGSVKTNIGHLESSAGISALMKTILMLHHRRIPPHINFKTPNPHIPWDKLDIQLPLKAMDWQVEDDTSRMAGISSFGFSGTNVHVVLEEYHATVPADVTSTSRASLLALSAKSETALRNMARRYAEAVESQPDIPLTDWCFSANGSRAHFHHRLAVVAEDVQSLATGLRRAVQGETAVGVYAKGMETPGDGGFPDLARRAQDYVAGKKLEQPDYGPSPRKRVLPFYPFDRESFPFLAEVDPVPGFHSGVERRPLLGAVLNLAGDEIFFEAVFHKDQPGLLADHRVLDRIVVPGAAFLEMAVQAGRSVYPEGGLQLEQISIREPLVIDQTQRVQTVLTRRGDRDYAFKILSTPAGREQSAWTAHVEGRLGPRDLSGEDRKPAELEQEFPITGDDGSYKLFAALGLDYGPKFQVLARISLKQDQAAALLEARDFSSKDLLGPTLLDGAFQLVQRLAMSHNPNLVYLPVGIGSVKVFDRPSEHIWVHVRIQNRKAEHLQADIDLYDTDGRHLTALRDLVGAALHADRFKPNPAKRYQHMLYRVNWEPAILTPAEPSAVQWAIVAEAGNQAASALAREVTARGFAVTPVALVNGKVHWPALFGGLHQSGNRIVVFPRFGVGETAAERCALDTLLGLSNAARNFSGQGSCYVVNAGSNAWDGAVTGFLRVAGLEVPHLKWVSLQMDQPGDCTAALLEVTAAEASEERLLLRDGKWYAARLVHNHAGSERLQRPADSVRLALRDYGQLEHLTLLPQMQTKPAPGQIAVQVHSAGLNFRDVLHALGMMQEHSREIGIHDASELPFGFECAGTVRAVGEGVTEHAPGDPVIAVLCPGSLADEVHVPAEFAVRRPANVSPEDAATLATTFATALYGLHHLADLKRGDKVLIHAAAGGVGLSALRLAQRAGAEVYATAAPAKHQFLRDLGVRHIANSRTLDFADQIMTWTNGGGVDVVLNSLNGDFIAKSISVLAQGGRFIEIGKLGIWSLEEMRAKRPDAAYYPFDLSQVAKQEPATIRKLMQELAALLAEGGVQPLPKRVFALEEAVDAFRFMAQAKHVGKIVIRVAPMDKPGVREDGAYLITGAGGALGKLVARRFADRGAKRLYLLGRGEPKTDLQALMDRINTDGKRCLYLRADVADAAAVRAAFARIEAEGTALRGVVHAAGVLGDCPLAELDEAACEAVLAPKVLGCLNLHQALGNRPLDFFVAFSSIAAVLGNHGQAGYAAANSFLDGFMAYRTGQGLAGTSLNWGAWQGPGMSAEARALERFGVRKLEAKAGLDLLEWAVGERLEGLVIADLDWAAYAKTMGLPRGKGLLTHLLDAPEETAGRAHLGELIEKAEPGRRPRLILDHMRPIVADAMGFDVSQLQIDLPLHEQGLDSLMAVELRNKLGDAVGQELPVSLFFDYPTLEKLVVFLLEEVLGLAGANAPRETAEPEEALSGDALLEELESLLD